MKKVLILSYFYPPCNLTASQRVGAWAKYLSLFGYYPIVVTRNWDKKINSPEDTLLNSGQEIIHEKYSSHEVFYLPYKSSKRDRIYTNNKEKKHLQAFSKILTFKDLLFENHTNSSIPFSNMYDFSKELLAKDKSIGLLIVSGNPFVQFKFGYDLNKLFGIKWIADYRDDWNTSEIASGFGKMKQVVSKIQSKSEKKWVGTAECITSVSKVYADKIGKFVNKKGVVILNGFDDIHLSENHLIDNTEFNITYNGSLYPTQPIEPILNALKNIIADNSIHLKIKINFPGLAFDKSQKKRIEHFLKGFENHLFITDRIPKNEVLSIQQKSDLLLMVAHENIKGIPSSKLYEYIGLRKTVLLYPNDFDIIEETLNETGLGLICNNEDDIFKNIYQIINAKQNGEVLKKNINDSKIEYYSRKNQTAELAKLLDVIV